MFETFLREVLKLAPRQIWGVEQQWHYLTEIFTSFSVEILMDIAMAIWALLLLLTTNWQMCVIAILMQEHLMETQM